MQRIGIGRRQLRHELQRHLPRHRITALRHRSCKGDLKLDPSLPRIVGTACANVERDHERPQRTNRLESACYRQPQFAKALRRPRQRAFANCSWPWHAPSRRLIRCGGNGRGSGRALGDLATGLGCGTQRALRRPQVGAPVAKRLEVVGSLNQLRLLCAAAAELRACHTHVALQAQEAAVANRLELASARGVKVAREDGEVSLRHHELI